MEGDNFNFILLWTNWMCIGKDMYLVEEKRGMYFGFHLLVLRITPQSSYRVYSSKLVVSLKRYNEIPSSGQKEVKPKICVLLLIYLVVCYVCLSLSISHLSHHLGQMISARNLEWFDLADTNLLLRQWELLVPTSWLHPLAAMGGSNGTQTGGWVPAKSGWDAREPFSAARTAKQGRLVCKEKRQVPKIGSEERPRGPGT